MKPRVILDIAFLGNAHRDKQAQRGANRVASQLFHGLVKSPQCELSFVATSLLAGAFDFLTASGLSPRKCLRYSTTQLSFSRCGRTISDRVHRSAHDRSLMARVRRYLLAQAAVACTAGEFHLNAGLLEDADIYHSPHTPFPPAVQTHPRLRKFITLHDFIPLKNPEYYPGDFKPFMKSVLACLTSKNFAFCVSNATRNDALNLSPISPDHVFVTPLAADLTIFHPVTDQGEIMTVCQRYGIPQEPYLLALSAYDRHKNFPHLIRCFGHLAESGELTDTNLVIVGSNPNRNTEIAEALARFPRIRPRVIMAGFVPDEDLAAVYSGAKAFLFPSLAEGFGMPPLEAMQCGTPVIASNTTSMPEVIGDAGILLPPTDEDAWCQAILSISRNQTLAEELREKSLRRCKLFSWKRFIDATLEGYRASLAME